MLSTPLTPSLFGLRAAGWPGFAVLVSAANLISNPVAVMKTGSGLL